MKINVEYDWVNGESDIIYDSVYDIVDCDGGYRLLRRYCEDGYIINGEYVTRVHFLTHEAARKALVYLCVYGFADGYEDELPHITWQERAVAEWCDWAPLAEADGVSVAEVREAEHYWWLTDVDTQGDYWNILEVFNCLEDYPDSYSPPR